MHCSFVNQEDSRSVPATAYSALMALSARHQMLFTFSLCFTSFVLPVTMGASQRLCEVQGTCFRCEPGHFSRFVCRSDSECFAGKFCVPLRGFCCPLRHSPAGASATEKCPDGGTWQRMCRENSDCLFGDEMCAEGKCCPSCRQKRVQSLREPNTVGTAWADRVAPGTGIPQCSDDGRYYRPMQCAVGSNECYCVDKYGRKIGPNQDKWWRKRAEEGDETEKKMALNCTELRKKWEEANGGREKPNGSLSVDPNHEKEEEAEETCADPLRVFRRCGSACPISCATRMAAQCPQEQCLRGCFCRLPYVVLDAANPFESSCVLPTQCPLLPFTNDLNSWRGGFFPAVTAPADEANGRTEGKCADPLKNFQSCGSACAVGCGRVRMYDRGEGCSSTQCVSGCFCRVPFLLRNASDPESACVLPQQCPSLSPPPLLPPFSAVSASPLLSSSLPGTHFCPSSEYKSWTRCFSRKCSRSCADFSLPPSSPCVPDDCLPGCQCYPPAVVKDKLASVWECILPENCPERDTPTQKHQHTLLNCEDPRKEFLTCGSSCPLGCDRLDRPSRTCSPCVSGCFCRNGFIFANASNWRNSACVPVSECLSSDASPVTSAPILQRQMDNTNEVASQCHANSFASNGPICESDSDCDTERKCCAIPFPSFGSSFFRRFRRCVCADSNALWSDCGSICAPSCANSAPRFCAGLCRPGCFCAPGFVKLTDKIGAECVPIKQCNGTKGIRERSEGNGAKGARDLSVETG